MSWRRFSRWAMVAGLAASSVPAASAAEGVILLHGLARTSRSMSKLETALARAGYTVLNVDYPSRAQPIGALAVQVVGGALADPRLRGCARVHFVTHSLGGVLVRSYFAQRTDPRLGRVVMLGPPNQGSHVVDRLRSWWLFRRVNGPAGSELGTGADSVPLALGAVRFELGVIAGNRSINWINSLMIPGDDDGKVAVTHTRVAGMKAHKILPVSHPFLMTDAAAIAAVVRFLGSGSFDAPARANGG